MESTVALESVRFLRKDPAKLPMVLSLYAASIAGFDAGELTRAAYFFIRHLDDALDGEIPLDVIKSHGYPDPRAYAEALRDQAFGLTDLGPSRIARLGRRAITGLSERVKYGEDTTSLNSDIIDELIFDYERRLSRESVSAERLSQYYGLFNAFLDITFIALGRKTRTSQFPDFGPSQGRLYSIRDLGKDWDLGIVNVPEDVLQAAEIATTDPYRALAGSPITQDWAREEVEAGRRGMISTLDSLKHVDERIPRLLVSGLAKGAMKGPFPILGNKLTE